MCVCVSLLCVWVCVCATKKWAHGRLLDASSSHTHELPAAAHIWGNQVASLSPYTVTVLSLTLVASLWLFCTFSLIIGIHCQCFPQTFLIRQCKQNGWVCGLPTHSLIHHLPARFVCPSANPSFSFTHSLSLSLCAGQVLLAVGILFDIRLAKWCHNAPTKAAANA